MAAPRRDTLSFLLICLATLVLTECAVIILIVLPLPSTRDDWLVATLFVAPMAALFLLWIAMLIARITCDVLGLFAYMGRLLAGGQR